MNALAPITSVALAESPPLADSLLNFLARAMADPNTNVDKLQVLLKEQREIIAYDARLQFSRAMSAAQGEIQAVLRDAKNDQTNSKYARLETIDAAIRPVYVRHGFCLEFNSESIEGPNERIVCEVSHTAGHAKKFQLEAAPDTAGPQGRANKTPLHGLGSTVSYLRRYLTTMIFNVVLTSDDNDGNRQKPAANEERVNGLLTRKEIEELAGLLKRFPKIDVDAFLDWQELADIGAIGKIAAKDFPIIKNELLKRLKVLTEREAFAARTRAAAARQPRVVDAWEDIKNGDRP
jgi:hypothetical protein